MIALVISLATLLLSLVPLFLFILNLRCFRIDGYWPAKTLAGVHENESVSVLIPARNEAAGIGPCLEAVLDSRDVDLEVIVLDDQSQDATAEVVRRFAEQDCRVRMESGVELPDGWNGKQHACWRLAQMANHRWLVFLDADVRIQPHALRDLIRYADNRKVALLSAFPHQQTGTLLEKMLIPMMQFVLLCYLPLLRMRTCCKPAYAAGCGQLFLTQPADYQRVGTHAAIRDSRHDGIKLPRAYRLAGLSTDVVDGTQLASCRMYRNGQEVVRGLLKNADEGIANATRIVPFSILLLGSSVVPWGIMLVWLRLPERDVLDSWTLGIAVTAVVVGWTPRIVNVWRFNQSIIGAVLHPIAVLLFVSLQWLALGMQWCGYRVRWRGRS